MDHPRRPFDPKVRKVGFFTPGPVPDRTQSGPVSAGSISPSGNSLLSPVMIIPPPRHSSDNYARAVNISRGGDRGESIVVGSYGGEESVMGTSPGGVGGRGGRGVVEWGGSFSDRGKFIGGGGGGFEDVAGVEQDEEEGKGGVIVDESLEAEAAGLVNVEQPNKKSLKEKTTKAERRALQEAQRAAKAVSKESLEVEAAGLVDEVQQNKKSLKEKTTKAERRAMQEAQRAAKAASKGINDKSSAAPGAISAVREQTIKPEKKPYQKKGGGPMTPDKKGGERAADKERKKDTPAPRLQFDDKSRVEKAKRRSLVKQTEAQNRVGLFLHLPQYEHGTQLPDLESRFFQLDPIHPSIHKVGLHYLAKDIVGENARCIAMLQAFQDAIKDYSTPPEKTLNRDLTAKVNSYVSFLIECRPLSVSMGNAIRYLKTHIAKLPLNLSESEARTSLCLDIERFIHEKILLADKVIISHAVTKIRDGDVLLIFGSSSVVEMILMHAYELGISFRVVVVDSRPKFEGQTLLRRLVTKGLSCTYTHISAASYIMHEVTRVFLGAASVLSNGTVYARVGTASIAMVAHAFKVPVLVCCEAYKFHERVQLDSICCNELGDPTAISKVPGRAGVNILDNCSNKENLQLLNLLYDATPSDYISMVITEYGMIPTTSVPVIVREYGREHLF
ncbi:hypothetical protein Leryth_022472 [Lithospermum erythrorhizon]|nr:hypothetical protein Leryth_022472 [Lithospermum erythrorhizon]